MVAHCRNISSAHPANLDELKSYNQVMKDFMLWFQLIRIPLRIRSTYTFVSNYERLPSLDFPGLTTSLVVRDNWLPTMNIDIICCYGYLVYT